MGRSEDQEDRPAKHPKPEAGAGKGKGQPKGRWPAGSGARNPNPRSTSQPTSQQELQMLRQVVTALCRLCLRHEDSINIPNLDTRLVLFCANYEDGLPSQLWRVAKRWKLNREANKVTMSLRVTMGMYILGQVKQGAKALYEKAQTSSLEPQQSIWFSQDRVWNYLTWNAQTKKHTVNTEVDPMSHDKVMEAIERLLELLPTGNVVHRLHSLRPFTETCEAPVVAFVLDIGLRAPEAQEAYVLVKSLCQLAVTQTASLNIRPDRLQRSALANHVQLQIAKLSSRSGWSIPPILVICMPFSPRGCGVAGPINLPCNRSVTRLERSRECLNSLLEARQPYTILDHPCWRTQFRAWQNPQVQHDIAEFGDFAASALFIDCMFYAWQSRIRIGLSCEVIEAGRACTLGLGFTVQPHLDLQGLINHWSMQAGTVAFSEPPTLAVIQVARFQGSGKLTCAI